MRLGRVGAASSRGGDDGSAVKRIILILAAGVAVVVAAVLALPHLIDWNEYKGVLAAEARALTGRQLTIGGDLRLAVLPAPALVARDVRLANVEGAKSPHMVRLKALRVHIAWLPMLVGRVHVETIRLVEPEIHLEVLPDGRRNWHLDADPAAVDRAAAGALGPALRLNAFAIENGVVVYRDARRGAVGRVVGVNADIAAASLSGPFESAGRLVAYGLPMTFEMAVGRIIHGRTVPLNARLTTGAGTVAVDVAGTATGLDDTPKFKGRIAARGQSLAALAQAAAGVRSLPGFLDQDFELDGSLVAAAGGIEIGEGALRLGKTRADGTASVRPGTPPAVTVAVTVPRVDLDRWLDLGAAATDDGTSAAPPGERTSAASIALEPRPKTPEGEIPVLALPEHVGVALTALVDAVDYRGRTVGPVRLSADLAGGEITVSQLTARLPGATDIAVFGFVTAADDGPRFDGEAEARAGDLRPMVRWLGGTMPAIPADRLRRLVLRADLAATPTGMRASGIEAQIDESRLSGGVGVTFGTRPAVDLSMAVDRLDVDTYLAASMPAPAGPPPSPSSLLAPLAAFDATVDARVGELVYRATPMKDVVFKGGVANGTLSVDDLSVARFAGASARVTGAVRHLDGVLELSDVRLRLETDAPERLLRLAGVAPPGGLGPTRVEGRLDGTLVTPALDLTVQTAGGSLVAEAGARLLPPGIEGRVMIRHDDLGRLLAAVDAPYRPAGPTGPVQAAARIESDLASVSLKDLRAKVGPTPVEGEVSVALGGARPAVAAALRVGDVAVERFLPASGGAREAAGGRLAGLRAFDATVDMGAAAVSYRGYRVEDASVTAHLRDGVLDIQDLEGRLFGGTMGGHGTLDATGETSHAEATVTLRRGDLGRAIEAVTGRPSAAAGEVGADLRLSAEGAGFADLAAAAAGDGKLFLHVPIQENGGDTWTRQVVPFKIDGPLNAPAITLATGALPDGKLAVPGLGAMRPKVRRNAAPGGFLE